MGTTSKGFRYPAGSDVPNVAQYLQNLASDVDSYLDSALSLITLGAGWDNYGNGYAQLQGMKLGALAVIIGMIQNTTQYSGTAAQTVTTAIPAALTPAVTVPVHGAVQSSGTAVQSARFDVGSNSDLVVYAPAGVTVAANSFHTLIAVYPLKAS